MLPKKERFTTLDFSSLRNNSKQLKQRKLITKYGFFVIYDIFSPIYRGGQVGLISKDLPKGGREAAALPKSLYGKKAVILSKKNFNTATLRNKIKRLFFNTIREEKSLKNKTFILYCRKEFTKEELMIDLMKI